MVLVFFAEGFEEIEALATVDLLRRAGIWTLMVSITGNKKVVGAHDITVETDLLFYEAPLQKADVLLLPGGMPGTVNLDNYALLRNAIDVHNKKNRLIAAICAAPRILGKMGLLKDKKATCYPGNEHYLEGAEIVKQNVVIDDNIITCSAAAHVFEFAFAIIEKQKSINDAREVAKKICYPFEK